MPSHEHPVVKLLEYQWHKIAALIMHKSGLTHVHITVADLEALTAIAPDDMPAVIVHDTADGLHVRLMPMKQAEAYSILHEKGELHGPGQT